MGEISEPHTVVVFSFKIGVLFFFSKYLIDIAISLEQTFGPLYIFSEGSGFYFLLL